MHTLTCNAKEVNALTTPLRLTPLPELNIGFSILANQLPSQIFRTESGFFICK